MDWTTYWCMLPVALGIATLANATGIEGATFFSPVFILLLRLDPRIAIGTAVITQVFGFGSSVVSFAQRKWIDYKLAAELLTVTVPLALLGAYFAGSIPTIALKAIFGVGLLAIGAAFLFVPAPRRTEANIPPKKAERRLVTAQGEEICYTLCNRAEGLTLGGVGGIFMGLIGSGQGELNGYFLLRRCQVPSKVAVATSALVVAVTGLVASLGYVMAFVHTGGDVLTQVASLVIYTVPGVIIGGQLAPMVSARLDQRKTERLLATIFVLIGGMTLWTTWGAIR